MSKHAIQITIVDGGSRQECDVNCGLDWSSAETVVLVRQRIEERFGDKVQLECFNLEENRYRCPRCKNTYQPNFEILPQEDILESSHEEGENEGALLLSAEDEFSSDKDTSKSDIKIPKYMQDSETTKVTYFREE